MSGALKDISAHDIEKLVRFRRTLHKYPEVSNDEAKTAGRVVSFLNETEPDTVLTGVGGHGVAAVYGADNHGPTLLFRCELDALPIREANSFDHNSVNDGVAHLCGHDGHMSIVAGLGLVLASQPVQNGTIILLFQPAEEIGEGAVRVLEHPGFHSLKPDFVFALHNLPGYDVGSIVVRDGIFASASKGLTVELSGAPSHAAHPADGRNPSLAACQLVQSLIALPQMHTELHAGALVTPVQIKVGGPAFGTSPGDGLVMSTLRSHSSEDMNVMVGRAEELALAIGKAYELDVNISWSEEFDAVVNDVDCVNRIRDVAGEQGINVVEAPHPFPWSEDFGVFTSRYPGALFGLGAGVNHPQLHTERYDFPDDVIQNGLKIFGGIVNTVLSR